MCTSPKTLSNQRFTDDLMRFRGAFVSKSKEPRRNGGTRMRMKPWAENKTRDSLDVDVESL